MIEHFHRQDDDVVLILEDAPYPDATQKHHEKVYLEFYDLQRAFSLLRGREQEGTALDVPLALLLKKWDRLSEIHYDDPDHEEKKLQAFLNITPPPPHKNLYDVLKSSVTEGNFRAFPVSVFGEIHSKQSPDGSVVECPAQVAPLKSFGLEDAFVWITQRRNAIDVHNYRQNITRHPLKKWRQYWQEGQHLLHKVQNNPAHVKDVKGGLTYLRRVAACWVMGICVVFLAIFLGIEATMDLTTYRKLSLEIQSPDVQVNQLQDARTWFEQYAGDPIFRHSLSRVFLSREQVQAELKILQEKAESARIQEREQKSRQANERALKEVQQQWMAIDQADIPALSKLLETASTLPPHPENEPAELRKERETLLARIIEQLQQQKHNANEKALKEIAIAYTAMSDKGIEALGKLLDSLNTLPPYPESEIANLRRERKALEQRISEELQYLVKQEEWEAYVEQYEQCMESKEFNRCARLLSGRNPETSVLISLKERFRMTLLNEMKQKVQLLVQNERFKEANTELTRLRTYPPDTKPDDKEIAALQAFIDRNHDSALYANVRKYKDREDIDDYLNFAPLKTMEKEVRAYKEYLDRTLPDAELQLRLNLKRIHWGKIDDSDNMIQVFLDDQEIITQEGVDAKSEQTTEINQNSPPFMATPKQRLNLKVSIYNYGGWNQDLGKAEVMTEVDEFAKNGYKLKINYEEGLTGTVYLELKGYPTPPMLPEWRKTGQ